MRVTPPSAGVVGWPVAHSRSPLIHRFWLSKLGIDGDYGRFAVQPDQLGAAIRALPALGLSGINVTLPHKVAVMDHLDSLTEAAARVGAVNCVTIAGTTLTGTNTDTVGVAAAIDGFSYGRVGLLGNGGAARATLWVLSQSEACEVRIVARDSIKSDKLLTEFGLRGTAFTFDEVGAVFAGVDLVINATKLGMTGEPPMPDEVLAALTMVEPGGAVFDMVYTPLDTSLLSRARQFGLHVIDGYGMLIGQAAAAFELFYEAPAPRQHDAELRRLLVA